MTVTAPNTKTTPKILLVAHDCGGGGAERMLKDEAIALRDLGWEVSVLIPCAHAKLAPALDSEGIEATQISYFWWCGSGKLLGRVRRLLGNVLALPRLVVHIRSRHFDLVHSHSFVVGVGAIAARVAGAPHVWHLHESWPLHADSDQAPDWGSRMTFAVARWTRSTFVAVSRSVAEIYEPNLGNREIKVLYQAVSVDRTDDPRDAQAVLQIARSPGPKLVLVGELCEVKGQDRAIKLMPALLQEFPEAKLFLAGSGKPEFWGSLQRLASELGVRDSVTWIGPLESPASALRLADISLVLSRSEGFGRVSAETLLAGGRLVAVDNPVNREVAGEHATYINPDDLEQSAVAIHDELNLSIDQRSGRISEAVSFASERYGHHGSIRELSSFLHSHRREIPG